MKKKKKKKLRIGKRRGKKKGRKWSTRKKGDGNISGKYNQQYPVLQFYKDNFSGGGPLKQMQRSLGGSVG